MVFVALIILWLAIFVFLAVYLAHTPKGSRWLRLILGSRKVLWRFAVVVLVFVLIAVAYALHPPQETSRVDARKAFVEYSRSLVHGLQLQNAFSIDSTCDLSAPLPELAYILPSVLGVYNKIVNKPTLPRLMQLNDTLVFSFDGYKQFKNRSINITKGTQKKLGPRYSVKMESRGTSHLIQVTYKGKEWDNEQLCALPAMEASKVEGVDPALLMSIIRHTSDFDFNYVNDHRSRGLLGLESGEGLEQVFTGAHMLKESLDTNATVEDAVALFHPSNERHSANSEWRKIPLRSSWVKSVLSDIQFYKSNGLK